MIEIFNDQISRQIAIKQLSNLEFDEFINQLSQLNDGIYRVVDDLDNYDGVYKITCGMVRYWAK